MNIGKKILSAFVEVTEEEEPLAVIDASLPIVQPAPAPTVATSTAGDGKFRQHFDSLFTEANLPGPDYHEFARMVDAMTVIQDEKSRYLAAFAGLSVQGLNKETLLTTAAEYLKIVEKDATAFRQTLDATLKEKVQDRQQQAEEKKTRIEQLTQEITALHNEVTALQNEIKEAEEKIRSNSNGYNTAAETIKARITGDIERIKQHVV